MARTASGSPRPTPGSRGRHLPVSTLVRVVAFAALVVAAAGWALVRHYSMIPPPMRVPIHPAAAPTYDVEAGELPVPETLEPDAS